MCNSCLIKTVQRCSPCGVLLLKKVCTSCVPYVPSVHIIPAYQRSFGVLKTGVEYQYCKMSLVFQMTHVCVTNVPCVPNISCRPNVICVQKNKALQIMMENISAMANINHMGGQSHLLPLITKSIDTTFISYQPFSCGRGGISSFVSLLFYLFFALKGRS